MARYFKKLIFLSIFLLLFFFLLIGKTHASYDPVSISNNKFGVHILFPGEIFDAQKLVDSQGGDWGYVTIPIQSTDHDILKWQKFMDEAKQLHLIPIIRLSTTGDYFNTAVWEKPKLNDIVDFANFLDSLNWPTKNRYIVVYNEVNRGDEWGGSPNPFEYADILDFASDTFKSKNPDFFVISAGMDNAAPNVFGQYMNEFDFMNAMTYEVPDIFKKIDGIASHSYPNPGFSQSPGGSGVYSFKRELNLAKRLGSKDVPVFITETGWSSENLPQTLIADYYKEAFENAWSDKSVAAVTPFILKAGAGPFSKFSLTSPDGSPLPQYEAISDISKTKGEPQLASLPVIAQEQSKVLPSKTFRKIETEGNIVKEAKKIGVLFKWLLNI